MHILKNEQVFILLPLNHQFICMFPASIYQARRRQLATALANQGLLLIMGNTESPMNYEDNTYPFRQDSNFLYFCGINRPGMALLLDTASGESTLYADDLSLDYQVWMGEQPNGKTWADRAGIEHWAPFSDLRARLAAAKELHYLPAYRADRQLLLAEYLATSPSAIASGASAALIRAVISLRSYKDALEVAEIEAALSVSARMYTRALELCVPGETELRIAGELEGIAIAGGGRLAYPAIISVDGHILHNHSHHNTLQAGQLLLLDTGAASPMQYASDITRTFPVSRSFSQQQQEIYSLVLESQQAAIDMLRPGITYREVHLATALHLCRGLVDLGLMQGDPAEAVAAGAHALFFPHGLGHMMGLDVHDMEDLGENWVGYAPDQERSSQFGLRSLRLARTLEPGFVLTVEPGLYFIPILIDRWQSEGLHKSFIRYEALNQWRNFGGIRIEDNILITEENCRILGESIPKNIETLCR